MDSDELEAKREAARLAMESEVQRTERLKQESNLEAKRQEARLAMEGSTHKQKREALERENGEREAMRQAVDDEVRKRKESLLAAQEAKLNADRQATQKAEQIKTEKVERYVQAESIIEKMKKESGSDLAPLRTYKSDAAKAMAEDKLSAGRIMVKEQDRRLRQGPIKIVRPSSGNSIFFILALLLVAAAAGGGYYYYQSEQGKAVVAIEPTKLNGLIFYEHKVGIDLSTGSPEEVLTLAQKAVTDNVSAGNSVTYFYFSTSTSAGNVPIVASLNAFTNRLPLGFPNDLDRFATKYMLGGISTGGRNALFLIFKVSSFENMSDLFLTHENDYIRNLFATLHGGPLDSNLAAGTFTDKLLHNVSVRVLVPAATSTQTGLTYGFLDRETLVMAEDEKTFDKVHDSYNAARPSS